MVLLWKKVFSIEKLNLVSWGGGLNFGRGSLLGRLFLAGGKSNFWPVEEGLPPSPSRENPVAPHPTPPPKKSVENFKPLFWLSSPRDRWKFKVPQGPIKLSTPSSWGEGGGDSIVLKTSNFNKKEAPTEVFSCEYHKK